jgi:hypothetical protein
MLGRQQVRLCVWILLGASIGRVSDLSGADPPAFSELLAIMDADRQNITSGKITLDVLKIQNRSEAGAARSRATEELNLGGLRQNIIEDSSIPESRRADLLRRLDARIARRSAVGESRYESLQVVYFDIPALQYRLDEQWQAREKTLGGNRQRTVTTNGRALTYFPEVEQAVFEKRKPQIPNDLPAFLGLLESKRFDPPPDEVSVSEASLDGTPAIRYRVKYPEINTAIDVYVDPVCGYRFRRVETYYADRLERIRIARDYQMFGQTILPTVYEDTSYEGTDTSTDFKRTVLTIREAELNTPLPEGTFSLSAPEGTWVTDVDLQTRFRVESVDPTRRIDGGEWVRIDDLLAPSTESQHEREDRKTPTSQPSAPQLPTTQAPKSPAAPTVPTADEVAADRGRQLAGKAYPWRAILALVTVGVALAISSRLYRKLNRS